LNNIWTDTRARTSLARGIALVLALVALLALLAMRPHDRSSWLAVVAMAGILAFLAPRVAARVTRLREKRPMRVPELSIADLLGREEVRIDTAACAEYLHDQVVLVTGAAGSIGSELCRQLLALRPRQLIVLDTNETGLFDLDADLQSIRGATDVAVCIADIADEGRVAAVFHHYRPHVVFHAAAYKHVPLLENHAGETVKTNVLGTALLCRHAHASGVRRFVFISSDKAVAPTSNLGYSKRIGELLVRGYARESETLFCAVRFGNVIGSRGSVIPTFERQIALGEPLTVTHPEATRFFMSAPEAVALVIQAAADAASGSILMLDMGRPVSIVHLAERMLGPGSRHSGVAGRIVFTGLRPGEKLHEALTSEVEETAPTTHTKILEVIDRQELALGGLGAIVRALAVLARRGDNAQVSDALRRAAWGQPPTEENAGVDGWPIGAPAWSEATLEEALTAAELAMTTAEMAAASAAVTRIAARLAARVAARAALDRPVDDLQTCLKEPAQGRDEDTAPRVVGSDARPDDQRMVDLLCP